MLITSPEAGPTERKGLRRYSHRREFYPSLFNPDESDHGYRLARFLRAVLNADVLRAAFEYHHNLEVHRNGQTPFVDDSLNPLIRAGLLEAIRNFLRESFPYLPEDLNRLEKELLQLAQEANKVVAAFRETYYPGSETTLGLVTAVETPKRDLLATPQVLLSNGNTDERVKYELWRQELIVLILLQLNQAREDANIDKLVHNVNDLVENKLFIGKYGKLHHYSIYSIHDNLTNECISVSETKPPVIDNELYHLKFHEMKIRLAGLPSENEDPVIVPVHYHFRRKSIVSSVVKALRKALLKGKAMSPEDVTDMVGNMFVVMDEAQLVPFMNRVFELLRQKYPNCIIKQKHKTGTNEDSSKSDDLDWNRCLLFIDENQRYPVELIFFTATQYFNYRYRVGKYDENGNVITTNGLSHRLYELRRGLDVCRLMFPKSIYGNNDENAASARKLAYQRAVRELFEANRLD